MIAPFRAAFNNDTCWYVLIAQALTAVMFAALDMVTGDWFRVLEIVVLFALFMVSTVIAFGAGTRAGIVQGAEMIRPRKEDHG